METSLTIKRQLPSKPKISTYSRYDEKDPEVEYEQVSISMDGIGDMTTDIINKLTEFCKEKGWLLK